MDTRTAVSAAESSEVPAQFRTESLLFLLPSQSNNLNVLRSIAVVLVFASHAIQYLTPEQKLAINLEHAGVLLFFVHTSRVLMLSLERQGPRRLWAQVPVRAD